MSGALWTADKDARLTALWAEGHSAAEIGRQMRSTKNSIVGRVHRLKLPARPSPIIRSDKPKPIPRAPNVTLPSMAAPPKAPTMPFSMFRPLPPRNRALPNIMDRAARRIDVAPPVNEAALEQRAIDAITAAERHTAPIAPTKGRVIPCEWIDGNRGSYRSCGVPSAPGRPYCPDHTARAFVPGKPMSVPAYRS